MTAAAAYTCVLSTYTRIFLAEVVGIRIILAGIRRIPAYTLDYSTGHRTTSRINSYLKKPSTQCRIYRGAHGARAPGLRKQGASAD